MANNIQTEGLNPAKKMKRDLSHINTYTDLKTEIAIVKARLKLQEVEIKDRLKKSPVEAIKLGASTVLPAFLATKVTTKTFGLVTSVLGLVFKSNKAAATKKIVNNAKSLGLFTGLKALVNVWKKKTEKPEETLTNKPLNH